MDVDKIFEEEREANAVKLGEDALGRKEVASCLEPRDGYRCTKEKDHAGAHAAHGSAGDLILRWEDEK